jgi:3-phosphoshikimate 1-carboxyvinyltransferase
VAGEIKLALQGDFAINMQSLQGDKAIVGLLKKMGACVDITPEYISVRKERLKAITADLNDSIDLLPTIAILASLAEGTSEFSGIRRARLKESNRVLSVKRGLERVGIEITEESDKLRIAGGKPRKATISSQNDHRIAMAFSIMGAAAGGLIIDGAECVSKTYPEYWSTLRSLGVKL